MSTHLNQKPSLRCPQKVAPLVSRCVIQHRERDHLSCSPDRRSVGAQRFPPVNHVLRTLIYMLGSDREPWLPGRRCFSNIEALLSEALTRSALWPLEPQTLVTTSRIYRPPYVLHRPFHWLEGFQHVCVCVCVPVSHCTTHKEASKVVREWALQPKMNKNKCNK